MNSHLYGLLALSLSLLAPTFAAPAFAGIFADHMVLQRDQPITVWGSAKAGEALRVSLAGQSKAIVADAAGTWEVVFAALPADASGYELRVNEVVIRDVVVGDVWHASGQSNMAMTLESAAKRLPQIEKDLNAARHPLLRFRRINESHAPVPQADILPAGGWVSCSPKTASGLSAAAFYFAKRLHTELDVPIGIIDSSRGGTPIEPFIPRAAFVGHPTLEREAELGDAGDLEGIWALPGGVRARDEHWLPGRLFNSRLAPIQRVAVKGAIWYQGESNCGKIEDPRDYNHKMRALIRGWRGAFSMPEMPLYFVQLPGSGASANWPYMRDEQRRSMDLPHTGMAVTIDLVDSDIHPPNKLDVGERLAAWALNKTYAKAVPFSGPLLRDVRFVGSLATIRFNHAESGLMLARKDGTAAPVPTPDAKLNHLEMAGSDGIWHPAVGVIRDQQILAESADVRSPRAVRYAVAINPTDCNLYNKDGFPASPFCTDITLLPLAYDLPKRAE